MTVEAKGIDEVVARLRGVQERTRDLGPVLEVIAADTAALIDDSFETSSSPAGIAWEGLSDATLIGRARRLAGPARGPRLIGPLLPGQARSKRRRGYDNRLANAAIAMMNGAAKPLIDTGRLRTSINARAEGSRVLFGTNVVYAGAMNFGSRPPRHYRPPRQFLPIEGSRDAYTLTAVGPAGAHWVRARAMVKKYILTGEVS